ncbi:unnamed protein product [Pedinophyceae sp. YPF-701]|nr:unnamed protein product [Pedinophyceae sp. YPF-701]
MTEAVDATAALSALHRWRMAAVRGSHRRQLHTLLEAADRDDRELIAIQREQRNLRGTAAEHGAEAAALRAALERERSERAAAERETARLDSALEEARLALQQAGVRLKEGEEARRSERAAERLRQEALRREAEETRAAQKGVCARQQALLERIASADQRILELDDERQAAIEALRGLRSELSKAVAGRRTAEERASALSERMQASTAELRGVSDVCAEALGIGAARGGASTLSLVTRVASELERARERLASGAASGAVRMQIVISGDANDGAQAGGAGRDAGGSGSPRRPRPDVERGSRREGTRGGAAGPPQPASPPRSPQEAARDGKLIKALRRRVTELSEDCERLQRRVTDREDDLAIVRRELAQATALAPPPGAGPAAGSGAAAEIAALRRELAASRRAEASAMQALLSPTGGASTAVGPTAAAEDANAAAKKAREMEVRAEWLEGAARELREALARSQEARQAAEQEASTLRGRELQLSTELAAAQGEISALKSISETLQQDLAQARGASETAAAHAPSAATTYVAPPAAPPQPASPKKGAALRRAEKLVAEAEARAVASAAEADRVRAAATALVKRLRSRLAGVRTAAKWRMVATLTTLQRSPRRAAPPPPPPGPPPPVPPPPPGVPPPLHVPVRPSRSPSPEEAEAPVRPQDGAAGPSEPVSRTEKPGASLVERRQAQAQAVAAPVRKGGGYVLPPRNQAIMKRLVQLRGEDDGAEGRRRRAKERAQYEPVDPDNPVEVVAAFMQRRTADQLLKMRCLLVWAHNTEAAYDKVGGARPRDAFTQTPGRAVILHQDAPVVMDPEHNHALLAEIRGGLEDEVREMGTMLEQETAAAAAGGPAGAAASAMARAAFEAPQPPLTGKLARGAMSPEQVAAASLEEAKSWRRRLMRDDGAPLPVRLKRLEMVSELLSKAMTSITDHLNRGMATGSMHQLAYMATRDAEKADKEMRDVEAATGTSALRAGFQDRASQRGKPPPWDAAPGGSRRVLR